MERNRRATCRREQVLSSPHGEFFELIVGHVAVPFALGDDDNEDEDETPATVGIQPRGIFAVSGKSLKSLHEIIEAALKDKDIVP